MLLAINVRRRPVIIDTIAPLLPTIGGVGAAAFGAFKGISFVREDERALKLRFEKALKNRKGEYKVVYPGLRLLIPTVHKLARIHVRQRVINLPTQSIMLSDNTLFDVSAVITAQVRDTPQDIYNAVYETTGVDKSLSDFGLTVVRDVLLSRKYSDLHGEEAAKIDAELCELLQKKADEWGIHVLSFRLSDCEPSDETARLIQAKAGMQLKVEGLNEVAKNLGKNDVMALSPSLIAGLLGVQPVTSVSTTTRAVEPGDDNDE